MFTSTAAKIAVIIIAVSSGQYRQADLKSVGGQFITIATILCDAFDVGLGFLS